MTNIRKWRRLALEILERRDLPAFVTPPVYPAGTNPTAMVAHDFNGDGLQDIAVTNQTTPGKVSVLLNTGGGVFGTATSFPTGGSAPSSLALGDVNGDGRTDLVVTNSDSGTVAILRGSGTGLFRRPITYAAGTVPWDVALGDLNGDGALDIVVANSDVTGTVSVLLNNGVGVFGPATAYAARDNPRSLVLSDFDEDGNLDVAVTHSGDGTMGLLFGRGDGTLKPIVAEGIGGQPYDIAAADVNADGNQDLVIAHRLSKGVVSVRLGNGDGTFKPAGYEGVADYPVALALTDVTGDGLLDVVTGNQGWAAVHISAGTGDGRFSTVLKYFVTGKATVGLILTDLSGDGRIDFAVTDTTGAGVAVMVEENGTFPTTVVTHSGSYVTGVGDFNEDGHIDPHAGGENKSVVWLGNGFGAFPATTTTNNGAELYPQAVADLNADGHLDLAVAANKNSDHRLEIYLGNGDGTIHFFQSYTGIGNEKYSDIEFGDLNGDGKLDTVSADQHKGHVEVRLGNGDGTFGNSAFYSTYSDPDTVAVGEFNGDGHQDLVVGLALVTGNSIRVLLGNGDGTFQPEFAVPSPAGTRSIAVTDLNGDGNQDLVTVSSVTSGPIIAYAWLGNGDGTFAVSSTNGSAVEVAAADMNVDGIVDIVARTNTSVRVAIGNGDGTFQSALSYPAGVNTRYLLIADFNEDGFPDVVVTGSASGAGPNFAVLLNAGDWGPAPITGGPRAAVLSTSATEQEAATITPVSSEVKVDQIDQAQAALTMKATPHTKPIVRIIRAVAKHSDQLADDMIMNWNTNQHLIPGGGASCDRDSRLSEMADQR